LQDAENCEDSSGRKRQKRAVRYSAMQNGKLTAAFSKTTHPSAVQRQAICRETGLDMIQVLRHSSGTPVLKACISTPAISSRMTLIRYLQILSKSLTPKLAMISTAVWICLLPRQILRPPPPPPPGGLAKWDIV